MKTHQEHLKYTFTETELKQIAQDLARENQEVETIEAEKKQVISAFTGRLTTAQVNVKRMSSNIREGYEYRSITCRVLMNCPLTGKKTVIREDTGEEVRCVDMDDFDRQQVMEFGASA